MGGRCREMRKKSSTTIAMLFGRAFRYRSLHGKPLRLAARAAIEMAMPYATSTLAAVPGESKAQVHADEKACLLRDIDIRYLLLAMLDGAMRLPSSASHTARDIGASRRLCDDELMRPDYADAIMPTYYTKLT